MSDTSKLMVVILSLTAWPFLGFLSVNMDSFVDLETVGAVWLVCFAATVLLYLTCRHFLGSRHLANRLLLAACVAFATLFTYGALSDFAQSVLGASRARVFLGLWAAVFLVVVALAWFLSSSRHAISVVAAGAAAMAVFALVNAAPRLVAAFEGGEATLPDESPIGAQSQPGGEGRPNVYFFVLDGYGRADNLKAAFDLDIMPFQRELEKMGFRVLDRSHANFPLTSLSVASTLSMDYIASEANPSLANVFRYQRILGGHNEVVRMFRNLGYAYVHAGSGGWEATRCRGEGIYCLTPPAKGLSETQAGLLATTPLEIIVRKLAPKLIEYGISEFTEVADRLVALSQRLDQPTFVFSHILIPHETVYGSDCRFSRSQGSLIAHVKEELKHRYADTVRCLNKQIEAKVGELIAHDPSAIVILQADHGFALSDMFQRPFAEWREEEIRWRYGIFHAIRVPARCREHLYPEMTPVNTFRLVRACVTGEEPHLLPDQAYLAKYYFDSVERMDRALLSE